MPKKRFEFIRYDPPGTVLAREQGSKSEGWVFGITSIAIPFFVNLRKGAVFVAEVLYPQSSSETKRKFHNIERD